MSSADHSPEASMDEILASIRRIISEDPERQQPSDEFESEQGRDPFAQTTSPAFFRIVLCLFDTKTRFVDLYTSFSLLATRRSNVLSLLRKAKIVQTLLKLFWETLPFKKLSKKC